MINFVVYSFDITACICKSLAEAGASEQSLGAEGGTGYFYGTTSCDISLYSASQPPKNENCKATTAAWTGLVVHVSITTIIIYESSSYNIYVAACACKLISKLQLAM